MSKRSDESGPSSQFEAEAQQANPRFNPLRFPFCERVLVERRERRCFLQKLIGAVVLSAASAPVLSSAATAPVSISYSQSVRDANYPELVYWFVTPETFSPGRAAMDVKHIANGTFFTFPFLTERNGVLLLSNPKANGFVPPS